MAHGGRQRVCAGFGRDQAQLPNWKTSASSAPLRETRPMLFHAEAPSSQRINRENIAKKTACRTEGVIDEELIQSLAFHFCPTRDRSDIVRRIEQSIFQISPAHVDRATMSDKPSPPKPAVEIEETANPTRGTAPSVGADRAPIQREKNLTSKPIRIGEQRVHCVKESM